MNDLESTKVTELERLIPLLADKDVSFATDLFTKAKKYDRISEKQMFWVEKLIDRALNQGDDGPDTAVKVGEFGKMIALFETANSKLKYPKLTFRVPSATDDIKVEIKRAGPTSKYHGQLMLSDGGPWGDNLWYGRIDTDGVFIPSNTGEKFTADLVPFLIQFAESPAEMATAYGIKHGKCCFCHKGLTHEKSTAAGFGETCAKNWGLHTEWKTAHKGVQA